MRRRVLPLALAAAISIASFAAPLSAVTPAQAAAAPVIRVAVAQTDTAVNASKVDGSNPIYFPGRVRNVVDTLNAERTVTGAPAFSVSVINDDQLSSLDALRRYDVVILVRCVATTQAERLAIRQYVAEGGGLISIFSTSRYDYRPGTRCPYRGNAYGSPYWPFNFDWGFSASSWMSQAFEYGELSELIGTRFCNDPYFYPGVDMVPANMSHEITKQTLSDLKAGGFSIDTPLAEYNETVWPTRNAPVTVLLNYANERVSATYQGTAYRLATAPWGHASPMAAWSMPYYYGKTVSFGFQLYDLLSQRPAARILVNSVKWAASHTTFGNIRKTPDVSVTAWYTRGQIWTQAAVSNAGTIQLRGQLRADFYRPGASTPFDGCYIKDPNGYIPVSPGEHYSDTAGRKPSVSATPGRWRVRVSYRYYDYFRGGWVSVYRDGYLDANGSGMTWKGESGLVGPTTSLAWPAGCRELKGADRYCTGVAISQDGWPNGVDAASGAVILASGQNFADALAAAPIAGELHAPILLTPTTGLPASVSAELTRLFASRDASSGAKLIVASTLPGSVVAAAQAAIAGAGSGGRVVDTSVIAGSDCYDTARRAAGVLGTSPVRGFQNAAFIVTSATYADALSAAPVAAKLHIPILFVTASTIPPATQQALAARHITKCIIIGSTAAVDAGVENWLVSHGYRGASDPRLQGGTRYDTCLAVLAFAKAQASFSDDALYVATGTNYPDALALAPLTGQAAKPVLLVNGDDIANSPATAAYLVSRRSAPPAITFAGSTAAVSGYVRGQVGVGLVP